MALPPPAPDRTCLVTGASSGIGVELARCLAERGHGVTLVARREDKLRAVAEELTDLNVRVEVIAADLADAARRETVATRVAELGLTVDVLVNNAGVTTSGPMFRSDRASELAMVRTDVEAVVDLCSTFVPGMVSRGRGAVLNVASTAAFQPLPGQAGYAASKAFVLSYSEALAAELRSLGVTVTVLCPGPVETGFGAAGGIDEEAATEALPKFMWLGASDVARAGIDGLARGRRVVIPGSANRLGAVAATLVPHGVVLPLLARQHPSMPR